MRLRIAHLYPQLMDLHGSRGNIVTLSRRCTWRGIEPVVDGIEHGDRCDPSRYDLLYLGGGQEREQRLILSDLLTRRRALTTAVLEEGVVLLAICGGFRLLGRSCETRSGERVEGLGLFDLHSRPAGSRLTGNIIVRPEESLAPSDTPDATLVGFENHAVESFLAGGTEPLGRVVTGIGNNLSDDTEGCRRGTAFGTQLHGPILPKNPHFADHLIRLALRRRYGRVRLRELDDELEVRAHRKARSIAHQKNSQPRNTGLLRTLFPLLGRK